MIPQHPGIVLITSESGYSNFFLSRQMQPLLVQYPVIGKQRENPYTSGYTSAKNKILQLNVPKRKGFRSRLQSSKFSNVWYEIDLVHIACSHFRAKPANTARNWWWNFPAFKPIRDPMSTFLWVSPPQTSRLIFRLQAPTIRFHV